MKFFAVLALICFLGFCGFTYAHSLKKRVNELKAFHYGMELLETEMVYAKNPLWLGFMNTANRTEGVVSSFFFTLGEGLRDHRFSTAEDGFLETLSLFQGKFSLQEKDVAILKQFAANLGLTDSKRQGEKIKSTQAALESERICAKEQEEKWGRVTGVGGWLMGIVIGLLLI